MEPPSAVQQPIAPVAAVSQSEPTPTPVKLVSEPAQPVLESTVGAQSISSDSDSTTVQPATETESKLGSGPTTDKTLVQMPDSATPTMTSSVVVPETGESARSNELTPPATVVTKENVTKESETKETVSVETVANTTDIPTPSEPITEGSGTESQRDTTSSSPVPGSHDKPDEVVEEEPVEPAVVVGGTSDEPLDAKSVDTIPVDDKPKELPSEITKTVEEERVEDDEKKVREEESKIEGEVSGQVAPVENESGGIAETTRKVDVEEDITQREEDREGVVETEKEGMREGEGEGEVGEGREGEGGEKDGEREKAEGVKEDEREKAKGVKEDEREKAESVKEDEKEKAEGVKEDEREKAKGVKEDEREKANGAKEDEREKAEGVKEGEREKAEVQKQETLTKEVVETDTNKTTSQDKKEPESKPVHVKPAALPDKPVIKPVSNRMKPPSKPPTVTKEASPQPPARTTYKRDFLLSFKQLDVCKKPPSELINHDCFRTP